MENFNTPIPGFNPLRFTPQMPYAQLPGLANTRGSYGVQSPNYIDPNQNSGSQYQVKSQWQFGINYNHLAFSNAVQGVGAFLRSNNQRNDFKQYNRNQQNPLSQIPENPNNTQQALYGDKQYKKGGNVKYEDGGQQPIITSNPKDPRLQRYKDSLNLYNLSHSNLDHSGPDINNTSNTIRHSMPGDNSIVYRRFKQYDDSPTSQYPIQPAYDTRTLDSDYWPIYNKPTQPYQYVKSIPEPKRSQVQTPAQLVNSVPQIGIPTGGSGPLAGGPTNFSFTGRNDQGQQDTRYFSDLDSWKSATDKMGYSNREISGDNKKANATGYQFAQGGQFDNYDDFDEEDFQDLKDELDNYFKDRGNKPIENLTEDKEDDQTQQDQPEQEDNYKPTGAMDFLNQQQPDYEQQDKSDKDIMDQLSGQQPIPEPQQTEQSQDDHPSIEAFKNGISRVENAGYNEGNKNSTAFGKYQFTAPTREGVRQQFFSTISKKDFEDAYKSDPKFQEKVMDVYGNHLLNSYGGDPHKAATAFFLGPGKANMYNQPNYNPGHGNISVGKYLSTFDQGYSKKKGGYIMEDGGQGPGDGKKATTSDSLAVYNNASQVRNYYLNNPDYHPVGIPIKYSTSKIFNSNDAGVQLMKNNNYNTIQPGHNTSTKITPDQYRKNVDGNKYYQRELQNTMLDLNSPMSLFDKRISPQFQTDYSNLNTGDVVTMNQYDPIAVKPWNMLTDDERKIRVQKYGDPTKGTSKLESTPPPMNRTNVQSAGSLRSPYGPVQGSTMIPGQLAGQGQTPYSFTGRDDNGQQTTRYFNDLDIWKNATDKMGYANREISGDNKKANATGYQFKEGGEYNLTNLQIKQLQKQGYKIEIVK